jgi:hypothetical protein
MSHYLGIGGILSVAFALFRNWGYFERYISRYFRIEGVLSIVLAVISEHVHRLKYGSFRQSLPWRVTSSTTSPLKSTRAKRRTTRHISRRLSRRSGRNREARNRKYRSPAPSLPRLSPPVLCPGRRCRQFSRSCPPNCPNCAAPATHLSQPTIRCTALPALPAEHRNSGLETP